MECIKCGGKTRVKDSAKYKGIVIRKRRCQECGDYFDTIEEATYDVVTTEMIWKYTRGKEEND